MVFSGGKLTFANHLNDRRNRTLASVGDTELLDSAPDHYTKVVNEAMTAIFDLEVTPTIIGLFLSGMIFFWPIDQFLYIIILLLLPIGPVNGRSSITICFLIPIFKDAARF